MRIKNLLTLALFHIAFFQFSQNNIDSLKNKLANVTNDTLRCYILHQLSEKCKEPEWWAYNDTLYELALLKSQEKSFYQKTYLKYYAISLANKGYIAGENNRIKESMEYQKKAIELYRQLNDWDGLQSSLNNMGFLYIESGDIESAVRYIEEGLKINEKLNNPLGIAYSLNNLADVYYSQRMYSKALEIHHKNIKILLKLKAYSELASCYNNISTCYDRLKKDSLSVSNALEGIYYASLNNDVVSESTAYSNLGIFYSKRKKHELALYYLKKAISSSDERVPPTNLSMYHSNIAKVYLNKGNNAEALKEALIGLEFSRKSETLKPQINSNHMLYVIYKEMKITDKALYHYEQFIYLNDSNTSIKNKKAGLKAHLKYEYEKKAAADSVKAAEEKKVVAAQLKQEKTQRFALYGGLGLVGLFALFMVNRFRVTNQQKKLIEEQKKIVETQKHLVEEKQREIVDSIQYAKRIQTALITSEFYIDKIFKKIKSS